MHELSDPVAALPMMVPPRVQFVQKMEELGVGDGIYFVIYDKGALVGNLVVDATKDDLKRALNNENIVLRQKNVAVYDGSMSEWVSNPECPLVTGG